MGRTADSRKLARAKVSVKRPRKFELGKPTPELVVLKRERPVRAATTQRPPPRYFVNPKYGPNFTTRAGATWMTVTIGPAQGGPGMYGSVPQPDTPKVMRALLDGGDTAAFGWVAGHLLNDNLGGPGVAKNMTPLSTAGNKNHLNTCETPIKNFVVAAYARTLYHKTDGFWFGVDYRVQVGDDKWDEQHKALKHVATELRIWAKVVKMNKATGEISDASSDESNIGCHFDPMINVAVENTGADNLMIE